MSVLPHTAARTSGQRQPRAFKEQSQPHTHPDAPEHTLTAGPGLVIKASGGFPSTQGKPHAAGSQATAAAVLHRLSGARTLQQGFCPRSSAQPGYACGAGGEHRLGDVQAAWPHRAGQQKHLSGSVDLHHVACPLQEPPASRTWDEAKSQLSSSERDPTTSCHPRRCPRSLAAGGTLCRHSGRIALVTHVTTSPNPFSVWAVYGRTERRQQHLE